MSSISTIAKYLLRKLDFNSANLEELNMLLAVVAFRFTKFIRLSKLYAQVKLKYFLLPGTGRLSPGSRKRCKSQFT